MSVGVAGLQAVEGVPDVRELRQRVLLGVELVVLVVVGSLDVCCCCCCCCCRRSARTTAVPVAQLPLAFPQRLLPPPLVGVVQVLPLLHQLLLALLALLALALLQLVLLL